MDPGSNGGQLVPKKVEFFSEVRVLGAAAGFLHTSVWTDEGQFYSFGHGQQGRLGIHLTSCLQWHQSTPRLVQGELKGKQVVGAKASCGHTAIWTDMGEPKTLFSLPSPKFWQVSSTHLAPVGVVGSVMEARALQDNINPTPHPNDRAEDGIIVWEPRLVEGLVGKKVLGAATGNSSPRLDLDLVPGP